MAQLVSGAIPHFAKPWQLMVSVCLTRMNKVTRELSDIEKRYAQMQEEMEFEHSVYNSHEYGKKQLQTTQLQNAEEDAGKNVSVERENETLQVVQQLMDLEDTEAEWKKDHNSTVSARKTKYDELDNYNVINRKLDDILHCVIKDKNLFENYTLYPYTCLEPEESLRSAAERLLNSYKLKENALFFSNAPVGVLKLNFNEKEERGALYRGAKLFFLKAHLHKPVGEPVDGVEWLTLEELSERASKDYFKKIRPFVC